MSGMKAVLLSVRPKWCAKIANKEKTLEVRKSCPKYETPFKCYIYQTKNGKVGTGLFTNDGEIMGRSVNNGKIIGEFVCDQIYQYSTGNVEEKTISDEDMQKQSCLTYAELFDYEHSAEEKEFCVYLVGLYGWHISALQIYNKPRELSEFTGLRKTKFGMQPVEITRAPQSWCYVNMQEETE